MFRLRFSDLFDTASANLATPYTLSQIILNVVIAVMCGLIVYFVYKKTYSGVLYSKNIGVTMVIVTVITSIIVMAIHGNLALSLGMVGALSIVRFRTPIKDPKDLAFLFWAISMGVICGIGAYKLALVGVIVIGLCLFVLSLRLGWSTPYLLIVKMKDTKLKDLQKLLDTECKKSKERSASISDHLTEVIFEIILKRSSSVELLNKIKQVAGVEKVVVISYDGELDESR